MHSARDIEAGRIAIGKGWLSREQAHACLEAAHGASGGLLREARDRGLLSNTQVFTIMNALESDTDTIRASGAFATLPRSTQNYPFQALIGSPNQTPQQFDELAGAPTIPRQNMADLVASSRQPSTPPHFDEFAGAPTIPRQNMASLVASSRQPPTPTPFDELAGAPTIPRQSMANLVASSRQPPNQTPKQFDELAGAPTIPRQSMTDLVASSRREDSPKPLSEIDLTPTIPRQNMAGLVASARADSPHDPTLRSSGLMNNGQRRPDPGTPFAPTIRGAGISPELRSGPSDPTIRGVGQPPPFRQQAPRQGSGPPSKRT